MLALYDPRDQTQGFMNVRHTLYQLSSIPTQKRQHFKNRRWTMFHSVRLGPPRKAEVGVHPLLVSTNQCCDCLPGNPLLASPSSKMPDPFYSVDTSPTVLCFFFLQRHPPIFTHDFLSWLSSQLYPQPMAWSLFSKKHERCSKTQELIRIVSLGISFSFLLTMQWLGTDGLERQPCSPSASSLSVLSCHRKLTELITQVSFHTSVILFGPH